MPAGGFLVGFGGLRLGGHKGRDRGTGAAGSSGLGGFRSSLLTQGHGLVCQPVNRFEGHPFAGAVGPAEIPRVQFTLGEQLARLIKGIWPQMVPVPVDEKMHTERLNSPSY